MRDDRVRPFEEDNSAATAGRLARGGDFGVSIKVIRQVWKQPRKLTRMWGENAAIVQHGKQVAGCIGKAAQRIGVEADGYLPLRPERHGNQRACSVEPQTGAKAERVETCILQHDDQAIRIRDPGQHQRRDLRRHLHLRRRWHAQCHKARTDPQGTTGGEAGGTGAPAAGAPSEVLFLRLTDAGASRNGRALELDALEPALRAQPGTALIISVTTSATAQLLTDTLVAVRGVPDLQITVLEGR